MSVQAYVTKVQTALKLRPQPDSVTCQSACIAMAIGGDIAAIRAELTSQGAAGDPANMGRVLRRRLGDRYSFNPNTSLFEASDALKNGAFCITHGWFTGAGHVIGLDGVEIDSKRLSYKFNVKDPWTEFDFPSWSYRSQAIGFDGYYSSYGMYAACVVGQSRNHSAQIYRRKELDSNRRGMWLHVIKP
ncbi:MAG: hypothetical protein HC781_01570 [Leptolyngbyaceae cyanobacterium CSU_1_4]|nr:hypothetical protein [Leptolyngbyaceae cyanobacterium CSU_1_4]